MTAPMDLQPIAPDTLETVSGGTRNSDTLTSLLSQITSSLKDLGVNKGNTSTTDMMMLMMVMLGGAGGGGFGGGGFFGGGPIVVHAGGGGGWPGPLPPCPPCCGW